MAKKPETTFKERVIRALKTLPNVWYVKTQEVGQRGIPDLLICIRGEFIALELKAHKDAHLSPLQEWTLKEIMIAGGSTYLSYPENWPATFQALKDIAGPEKEYQYSEKIVKN